MVDRTDGATTALRLGYEQLADVGDRLSWRDLLYGWDRGCVDADAVVRLAAQRLRDDDHGAPLELALLLKDQHAAVPDLLRRAADTEPSTAGDASQQKWMYLLLRALYRVQDQLTEPLAAVEDVYELFDHPEELAGLIYYMPVPEGEEPGEAAIYDRWRRYLKTMEPRLQ